jgi:hypothetical protein
MNVIGVVLQSKGAGLVGPAFPHKSGEAEIGVFPNRRRELQKHYRSSVPSLLVLDVL